MPAPPRAQTEVLFEKRWLPSMRAPRPFLTVTSIGQREEHISQTLATFFSVPPVTALAFKFRFNVASVPIAALLFRKFRLSIKTPYL